MAQNKLTWRADFSNNGGPNHADWAFDLGGGGWGNNEAQVYTDRAENAWVEDGVLHLCARKEADGTYTSARLTTSGRRSWQYGRVEVEAKLPAGKGTWPAIWMLSDGCRQGKPWPFCGEIDIMEHVGWDMNQVHYSLHSERYNHMLNTQKTRETPIDDVSGRFHTYAIDWNAAEIRFLVDNVEQARFAKGEQGDDASEAGWPFDQPFFLIVNVALAGWGGPIDDAALPCEMQIRAIHVYQPALDA